MPWNIVPTTPATAPTGWPTTTNITTMLNDTGIETIPSDALLGEAVSYIAAVIEKELDRSFTPVTGTKRYSGDRTRTLFIDRCYSITAVQEVDYNGTVISTYTANDDYIALPDDPADPSASANEKIKDRLERRGYGTGNLGYYGNWGSYWPKGTLNIKVSATFGEPIPADIWMCAALGATLLLLDPYSFYNTGIRYGWTHGPISEETGQDTLRSVRVQWEQKFARVLALHRGETLYF